MKAHPKAALTRLKRTFCHGFAWLAVALSAAMLSGCGSDAATEEEAIVVGLLLPFTGSSSATAANFERATLYAADRINAAGGVQGYPITIVSKDTHSDLARSKQSARELIAAGASIVLGPESADIAHELAPLFTEHDVVFVSPLVGDAGDQEQDCEHPWFRLSPSATALGEALAKQLHAEQVNSLAILSTVGAYDASLSRSAGARFESLGGSVVFEAELPRGVQSYATAVAGALEAQPDAVLLAASPRSGALVVNESRVLSKQLPRWSLSPLLKTELFTLNIDSSAVESALGVAPKIFDRSQDFPNAFAARWLGDIPLEGAYFYYDAVSLVALALQVAELDSQGRADDDSLREALRRVAAPPGESAGWDEVEQGLRQLAAGESVYYSGLTGPMLLDRCGARRLGVTTSWTVRSGEIIIVN